MTIDDLKAVFDRVAPYDRKGAIRAAREWSGISYPVMMVRERTKANVARTRWRFWATLKLGFGMSYPQIAQIAGNDHTSVIHGVQMFCKENDIEYVKREVSPPTGLPRHEVNKRYREANRERLNREARERYRQAKTDDPMGLWLHAKLKRIALDAKRELKR